MLALFAGHNPSIPGKKRQLSTTAAERIAAERRLRNASEELPRAPPLESLPVEQQALLKDMALWFVDWETAYDASLRVWDVVQKNPAFPMNVLISLVELGFANFLLEVVRDCAAEADGFSVV
jgi:hypothetical protein